MMAGSLVKTLLLMAISLLLAACSLLSPVVQPGEVLFQDDFSRSESGWDRYKDEVYHADYFNGGYRLELQASQRLVWSRPHLEFDDVLIRVEARRVAGPTDNVYGVICRYQDRDHFYFFVIASDGYAGIGRYLDGKTQLLNHETLLPASAIGPVDESNLIQAACVGEDLTLWVNGEIVAEANALENWIGDVGLLVGSYEQGGVVIHFDNFSTLKP